MVEWTPFTCLPKAALTPSGLLQLETSDGEVELIRRGPVEMRFEGLEPMCEISNPTGVWQSRASDLKLTITTHRMVFFSPDEKEARFLHLSNIHTTESTGGATIRSWNASSKLVLSTYTYGDILLAFKSTSSISSMAAGHMRDACAEHVSKALERRLWERAQRLQEKQQTMKQTTKRRVGVDHILTTNKMRHTQAKKIADEALSGNADELLQEAAELLQVIQKYVATIANQKDNGDDNDNAQQQQLTSMLQDMGMTSALTKDQVSSHKGPKALFHLGADNSHQEYYELLARQVVDFLLPKLPHMGGILSLTDVFCLFNRARGTNLVSPEDLATACSLLDEEHNNSSSSSLSHLGIVQRTFPSGIVVLQLHNLSSCQQTREELWEMCPTTALEASHVWQLSPLLAQEQLCQAERQGWLCRDTTLETTRFYPNYFEKWAQEL